MKKRALITGNSGLMRSINRNLIIQALLRSEEMSRSELAARVGLALPTIMRIIDTLIEEGLVVEVGKGDSTGGRKPIMLRMNPDAIYFIGVSVQRILRVVLTDLCGHVRCRSEVLTRSENDAETILGQILGGIDHVIANSGVDPSRIATIGVGLPGTLFRHGEELAKYPFKIWAEMDLRQWAPRFPYPVTFENIAKVGALGELMFGHGRDYGDFVYVFADYGIGSGIVQNGKLYKGHNAVAGDIGHCCIERDGEICYCGNRGCLEMYCATPAILRGLRQRMPPDRAPQDFSDVIAAYRAGEPWAVEAIAASSETLGQGLGNLVNVLNPNTVVIGGELADDCPGYVDQAATHARTRIFSKAAAHTPILHSALGQEGILLGAIALAMNQVFESPQIL